MNPNLETALKYLRRGWSIIPVHLSFEEGKEKANKKPLIKWSEYAKRLPSEAEVVSWWNTYPTAGVGIITGSVSGIVIVDIDIGYKETDIEGLNMPETLTAHTPSGGRHLYFRTTRNDIKTIADLFRNGSHIDIRGEGGFVVAPPSTYPDARPYFFESEATAIAELPAHLLSRLRSDSNFKEAGRTIDFQSQGVAEGGRNNRAVEIVGRLLATHQEEEWESKVWPAIQEWNTKNSPPLSERELRSSFESIVSREQAKRSGTAIHGIGEAIILKDFLNMEFPAAVWAIEALFEMGTLNMISAAPNQYKSWIVQHMAFSIAAGLPVFGYFPTTQQKVMIVNEEDPERDLKDRSLKLLGKETDLPVFFHIAKDIKIEEMFVSSLLAEMEAKGITFVIFDSLRSVHSANENDSKEMQVIMDQFKRFWKKGITVLFTHHHRKKLKGFGASSEDQSGGEESRGSSSINGSIHGHISCDSKRNGDQITLLISQHKLKNARKIDPFKVLLQEDEETGQFVFSYLGEYDGEMEAQSKIMESILGFLATTVGWLSIKDLLKRNLARDRALREAVRTLVAKGKLIQKTRKELEKEGHLIESAGSPLESFFSLTPLIENNDAPYEL